MGNQSSIIFINQLQSIIMKKSIIYLSFIIVALFSNTAVASITLSAKNNTNTITIGEGGETATPLAIAISKGDVATVKKLINYGIDINQKSNGMTPLMIAARYNQVEIINLLLEKGAKLNTTDKKGFSALKYAQLSNAKDAIGALTQYAVK